MKKIAAVLTVLAGSAAALMGSAAPAAADVVTYTFNVDQCSGGCGLSSYGTVKVTDVLGGGVTVDVDLANNVGFVTTGGGVLNGDQLYFNLASTPVTITSLPGTWTATAGSFGTNGGNGTFDYKLDCNGCGPGGSNPYFPEFTFNITTASVTTASFLIGTGSSDNAYFVADIGYFGSGGGTGRVAATKTTTTTTTKVPEPLTLSLFGAGLAGAAMLRRKKKVA